MYARLKRLKEKATNAKEGAAEKNKPNETFSYVIRIFFYWRDNVECTVLLQHDEAKPLFWT